MNKLSPVYTLQNECNDCYKCLRECPVKAIKIEDGHASVLSDKCLACGGCVQACPARAKRVRSDIARVKTLLAGPQTTLVSLAPSWAGVFDFSAPTMIRLLKKIGFSAVSETALGAQEVSIESARILNAQAKGLFISSACPVVVDYIRLYKTDFSASLLALASPALTHAQMLKARYGRDSAVVFIGPCIAKKNEADRHPELIDAALTFEELNCWLKEEQLAPAELRPEAGDVFVPEAAYEGALYPLEGGMNITLQQSGVSGAVQLLNISSLATLDQALNGLQPQAVTQKIFIEALACSGGCANGPALSSAKPGVSVILDIKRKARQRAQIPAAAAAILPEQHTARQITESVFPLQEILAAMKKLGKYTEEDELNCGACGYQTCRALARALLRGEAEPSMCASYMRKLAARKAAAMFRCMPSAVIIADSNGQALEANDAFLKMFCGEMYEVLSARPDGLAGAQLDKIIDFADIFRQTLKTGQDIHQERYPAGGKLYDISAFTIEPGVTAGAIITDVTQSAMNREKIAHKAREVLAKNITIVQDIACLLGEHMVDTELLLNSIAQDFEPPDRTERHVH
ncbi:MAG: 4Fe-4S dicluster domain-containing protein [Candidatus Margulisbacteria bacterium]|jgi:iron only hydrogenase large subunit-like protein|nr:4Fe-4S dicluster domain-containing protein [Candidatus Margulisiibacteriota bacterium]